LWGPENHSGHDEKISRSSSIHLYLCISTIRLRELNQMFVFQMLYVSKSNRSIRYQKKLSLEEGSLWKLKEFVAIQGHQRTYWRDRKSRFNTTFPATEDRR
jgi:hypothetical protein